MPGPSVILTDLSNKSLSSVDSSCLPAKTTKLLLNGNPQLSLLPDILTQCLTYLDISKCSISSFSFPPNLFVLKASHNKIPTLPRLPSSLVSCIADHNYLTSIDFGGSKKSKLQTLILSYNRFETIDIPKYHSLQKISLGHCLISTFTCAPLLTLKELRLSDNRLIEIPIGLAKCTSLEILCLRNNLISDFSSQTLAQFSSLVHLRRLGLSGNPGIDSLGEQLKVIVLEVFSDLKSLDDKPIDKWKPKEKSLEVSNDTSSVENNETSSEIKTENVVESVKITIKSQEVSENPFEKIEKSLNRKRKSVKDAEEPQSKVKKIPEVIANILSIEESAVDLGNWSD
ncbi:hypothetical protein RCL1_002753 [Eukaryota sp. TZLM3-RCL]